MKKIVYGAIVSVAFTLSAAAHAATDTSTESSQALRSKQMDECFRAHATLMDKPAVRNRVNCWMAHRHLMQN